MRAKGIYLLYRALQVLAWPAIFLYFALRAFRNPQYQRSLKQRAGLLPPQLVQTVPGCIWLHAVSVGEIIASIELIRTLRRELPRIPIYVSASTLAGYAMGCEKLTGPGSDLAAGVLFAPIDYVFAVRGTLKALKPSVLVILETEIWPNLIREARRSGASVVMINGRISDRTARRYARFRWFFSAVLPEVNRILAQSEPDRMRFLATGATPAQIEDGGNLKYDFEPREAPSDSPVRRYLEQHAGKRVWIAASTTADENVAEEDLVLEAFTRLAGWVLILAPRKPDRFNEVDANLAARGLPFIRRTQLGDEPAANPPDILLLDTIGELAGLFSLADVVFMGGSLANRGGHNILEPAFFGKPVITGPHLENFREIAADFRGHNAVITIQRGEELAPAVLRAADDGEVGMRARSRAAARRGATAHAVRVIREFHACSLPMPRPNLAARFFLTPLTWIWRKGTRMRAEKARTEFRSLDVPVVSVGNLTTGGTGKTPFVVWLTQRLKKEGHSPGILTRGYGRRSHENILAVPAGGTAAASQTGDEAQIFLRTGVAAVGIASDRYTVGVILCSRFDVDILVLDDGYQHRKLKRDLDIVLIDALAPFGNGKLMPLGRLREPLSALRRAEAFVITRSEQSRILPAIERKLREHNPAAPLFHASTVPDRWVDLATGQEYDSAELASECVIAFCGLGNPNAFWQTLADLGIKPAECVEYSDHHAYSPAELTRLGQLANEHRATRLLTTEKDAVNLCEGTLSVLGNVKLLWLRIHLSIDNEAALMDLVTSHCAAKNQPGTEFRI